MKKYQSHKIVHAGLIIGVETGALADSPVVIHVQGANKPFQFDGSFIARGTPVKNYSYLVLYNEGTDKEYYAWCPKDIFEEGNHIADEDEPTIELKINDRRVPQKIRDDAMALVNLKPGDDTDYWLNTWLELALMVDRLDAMTARRETEAAKLGVMLTDKESQAAISELKNKDVLKVDDSESHSEAS